MRPTSRRPVTHRLTAPALGLAMFAAAGAISAQQLQVVGVQPAPRSTSAQVQTAIRIRFDRPVDPASVSGESLRVFGHWSGAASGNLVVSPDGTQVTLSPATTFSSGEMVLVSLSNALVGADGSRLQRGGFAFQFWTKPSRPGIDFSEIDVLSTRATPEEVTRAYGGIATDVNQDGYPDLTIVNEVTDDLRTFLNRADDSALFDPYLAPPATTGSTPSPIEPSDFDGDGLTDVVTANTQGSSLSALLGNGDGTFQPEQRIDVGDSPRGLAVFDVDGDGDQDIVSADTISNSLSLSLNDGTGFFSNATPFEGGVDGERALAAADMNEDGLLDLVIGGFNSETVGISLGNGDGTFTPFSVQQAGGSPWMLVVGDVNGDGHDDVATVNSNSGSGSILLGDGLGSLGQPADSPLDPTPIATDLGDLDGDGDLDWVTSSFFGDWLILLNDGNGTFTFHESWPAPEAASCALAYDGDNDGDLDLALVDELADVVILLRNGTANTLGCGEIESFTANCTAGTQIRARLLLLDESHDGETVVLTIDGEPFVLTINGSVASLSEPGTSGHHSIALDDPAGCVAPVRVTCP